MNKHNRTRWISKNRLLSLLAVAATALYAVNVITGIVKADGTAAITVRTAVLLSPTPGVSTSGLATWQLLQGGNRELEIEVEDVRLDVGTVLTASIGGNNVGQLQVDAKHKARLKLRSEDGQTVPEAVVDSIVQVRNGSNVMASGIFKNTGPLPTPTASPSPSPTGSPSPSPSILPTPSPSPFPSPAENEIFAGLSGATLNGVVPTGVAQFEVHSSRVELEVGVRRVALPAGTSLDVNVDGVAVGSLVLQKGNEGRLRLRSDNGQTVPVVISGSTIEISNTGAKILSGVFKSGGTPSPTPSPVGTVSPTPTPSPAAGRFFESHLTGSQVLPPVTTAATGEVKLTLNQDGNQVTLLGEFHGLSSDQTGGRIETTVGTITTIRDLGTVGGRNGKFAPMTFDVTPSQAQQIRAGLCSVVITSVDHPNGEVRGQLTPHSQNSDLNGDGINDFSLFRPSTGIWFTANADGITGQSFGSPDDRVVSGDYDGDGRTDVAVYRNVGGLGVWEIRRSSDGGTTSLQFGLATDTPLRGDFDGDGRLDYAVFRAADGVWYVLNSNGSGMNVYSWGLAEDKPLAADMDGDGKDDITVFRPSNGNWYWLRSSDGLTEAAHWGLSGDIPVTGDFDGDGKVDLTVFRPSEGMWFTYRSSDQKAQVVQWGIYGDIPVAGRYDSDGMADVAVYRPSDGIWYVLHSSDGSFQAVRFGLQGDVPLMAN